MCISIWGKMEQKVKDQFELKILLEKRWDCSFWYMLTYSLSGSSNYYNLTILRLLVEDEIKNILDMKKLNKNVWE